MIPSSSGNPSLALSPLPTTPTSVTSTTSPDSLVTDIPPVALDRQKTPLLACCCAGTPGLASLKPSKQLCTDNSNYIICKHIWSCDEMVCASSNRTNEVCHKAVGAATFHANAIHKQIKFLILQELQSERQWHLSDRPTPCGTDRGEPGANARWESFAEEMPALSPLSSILPFLLAVRLLAV